MSEYFDHGASLDSAFGLECQGAGGYVCVFLAKALVVNLSDRITS